MIWDDIYSWFVSVGGHRGSGFLLCGIHVKDYCLFWLRQLQLNGREIDIICSRALGEVCTAVRILLTDQESRYISTVKWLPRCFQSALSAA